jgi:hypothetical protein
MPKSVNDHALKLELRITDSIANEPTAHVSSGAGEIKIHPQIRTLSEVRLPGFGDA